MRPASCNHLGDAPPKETAGAPEASSWGASLAQLTEYQRAWGNADAPRKTALGDWCAASTCILPHTIQLHALIPPSPNPQLCTPNLPSALISLAAVRRCRAALSEAHVAELDEIGFEWTSSRKCGSAFQDSLRRLRAFWAEHGHTDVHRVLGEEDELSLWCESQRAAWRDGRLSPKRSAPLKELGLLEGTQAAECAREGEGTVQWREPLFTLPYFSHDSSTVNLVSW